MNEFLKVLDLKEIEKSNDFNVKDFIERPQKLQPDGNINADDDKELVLQYINSFNKRFISEGSKIKNYSYNKVSSTQRIYII